MALSNPLTVDNWCFKLVMIGDGATGKTTLVNRLLSGEFRKTYIATIGAVEYPLNFFTNRGKFFKFDLWDIAGQEKNRGIGDAYYVNGKCGIIMFDVTSRISYRNVPTWYNDLCNVCGNIPIVLCGNKVDDKNRQVEPKDVTFHRENILQYCEISVKDKYNIEMPFLYLARKLVGDDNLQFVEHPVVPPPQVQIDLGAQQQQEAQLAAQPLSEVSSSTEQPTQQSD